MKTKGGNFFPLFCVGLMCVFFYGFRWGLWDAGRIVGYWVGFMEGLEKPPVIPTNDGEFSKGSVPPQNFKKKSHRDPEKSVTWPPFPYYSPNISHKKPFMGMVWEYGKLTIRGTQYCSGCPCNHPWKITEQFRFGYQIVFRFRNLYGIYSNLPRSTPVITSNAPVISKKNRDPGGLLGL